MNLPTVLNHSYSNKGQAVFAALHQRVLVILECQVFERCFLLLLRKPTKTEAQLQLTGFPLALNHADKSCSSIFFSALHLPIVTACLSKGVILNLSSEPLEAPGLLSKTKTIVRLPRPTNFF